jgi:hypothetical protein
MSWSSPFDDPIQPPKGKPLLNAANRITMLKNTLRPAGCNHDDRMQEHSLFTASKTAGASKACSRAEQSRRSRSYLGSAQAYMLISMPTCTSTIFGVFQVI